MIGLPPLAGAVHDRRRSRARRSGHGGGRGRGGDPARGDRVDAADAGPVPTPLVAVTLKVYAVPLVSPVTVVDVAGGDPLTVVAVWAVAPMNGVTV